MEKYIVYEEIDKERGKVTKIIERPADEQLEEKGFYVDSSVIPALETPAGMLPILIVNLSRNEFYYEYEATPLTVM